MKFILQGTMLIFLLVVAQCRDGSTDYVAWIDKEPVTRSEMRHWILLEKANMYNYFYRKYKVVDSKNFWTRKLADEIPLERLKETALEKVKRCKVQQILAWRKGIIHTANFDAIVHALDSVNKERMKMVENGEPVYGPKQFTVRTYFAHVFDKMVIELKGELAGNELKPDEQQILAVQSAVMQDSTINVGSLNMFLIDKRYEQYIDSLVSWSVLDINEKVYGDISLE